MRCGLEATEVQLSKHELNPGSFDQSEFSPEKWWLKDNDPASPALGFGNF